MSLLSRGEERYRVKVALHGPVKPDTLPSRVEADAPVHADHIPASLSAQEKSVARQAYAGLLWSKQFYHYVVKDWLAGDPSQPPPPASRLEGRNETETTLFPGESRSVARGRNATR